MKQTLWTITEHPASAVLHSQERCFHCDVWPVLDSYKPGIRNEIEQETHLEVGQPVPLSLSHQSGNIDEHKIALVRGKEIKV